jgi:hypothetical protein
MFNPDSLLTDCHSTKKYLLIYWLDIDKYHLPFVIRSNNS